MFSCLGKTFSSTRMHYQDGLNSSDSRHSPPPPPNYLHRKNTMKASTLRFIKRLIILLPVIWVVYAIHEMLIHDAENDKFDNLPPNIDKHHQPNEADSQSVIPDRLQMRQHFRNAKPELEKKDSNRVLRGKYINEHLIGSNVNRDYNKEHADINSVQEINGNKQQLDKLAEIGGVLIQKKPEHFFANVTLPVFNNKQDPAGPGENGYPVKVDVNKLSSEEKARYHKGWGGNSFNQYASDLISVHRNLNDGRSAACKRQAQGYSSQLPQVSVIIIFHNEAWSVLLRSVHSILSRTPEHILREVILVDDYSSNDYLKEPLEKYFNDFPKVQIIRATKRQGLTRARLLGYYLSTSPIVVFLDSHIECFPGWAEPLIVRINEDPTRVVFPSIEVIADDELQTSCNSNVNQNGIFVFKDLTFQWQVIPQEETNRRKDDSDPIRSPTMPGGLFAISREFFDRLGTYDPGLDYWGGENIELSFKAWMCGGSVEMVTCSHIGHIFRRTNPIHWPMDIGSKNSIRVAEVWMDDYKNYFYERILYRLGDYGDVTERKQLRERLKCKSFEWYLRNVYTNVALHSNIKYAGEIRNGASPRCVDSMGGPEQNQHAPKMYQCHGLGYNQFWYFSGAGQIHQDDWHICASNDKIITAYSCTPGGPTWKYREDMTILHIPTSRCLTASLTSDDLSITNCSGTSYQKWKLEPRRTDVKFPL